MANASVDGEQFCKYCGRELIIWKVKSLADAYTNMVYLRCPNYGEFRLRFWPPNPHREFLVRTEDDETVLNYDPITGERIKRANSKRIS